MSAAVSRIARQVGEYFEGARRSFDLPLAPAGTAFQCAVWDELLRIPFGETISYGMLAARLGRPAASRAVGRANGANPIPLIIPCHRVIGMDGALLIYNLFRRDLRGALHQKTLQYQATVASRKTIADDLWRARKELRDRVDEIDLAVLEAA